MSRTTLLNRLLKLVDGQTIVSLDELRAHGIHRQVVRSAVDLGSFAKLDRGIYLTSTGPLDFERRMLLACRRVPHGVVCLESALRFHGVLDLDYDVIWMAIDRKARKPAVKQLGLRFIRFSGDSLAQGVVNTRIDGVPIRICTVAKTVAHCLKYRNKIGLEIVRRSFRESFRQSKCSREPATFCEDLPGQRDSDSRLCKELSSSL